MKSLFGCIRWFHAGSTRWVAPLLGAVVAGGLISSLPVNAASTAEREAEYYPLTTFTIPQGIVLEAGSLATLPGKRLAVSTRLGDIYLVDGAFDKSPDAVKFTRYASGLHEVL